MFCFFTLLEKEGWKRKFIAQLLLVVIKAAEQKQIINLRKSPALKV